MAFKLKQKNDIKYLVIPAFESTGLVKHAFSTRSLDFNLTANDMNERILQNYKLFCQTIGIEVENLVASDQTHEDEVYEATEKDRGKGILLKSDIKNKDALITKEREVALITYHADCVPLFFLDVKTPAIGLAHAGWRGTMKKIGPKTVAEMVSKFGTHPENILVGIGPCIKKCCFEVDEPVIIILKKVFENYQELIEPADKKGHWMLDLVKANQVSLIEAGIKPSNIWISDYCTCCHNDLFFSFRGDKKKTGNQIAVMELK